MPWKNGGGSTTEIARAPAGESLDDFDWRVSIAQVASAGPFSRFAGVDRSIAVLEGEGLRLAIEGTGTERVDRRSPPFSFPADVGVEASLLGGATLDFNVMTRRGRFRHELTRTSYDARAPLRDLGHVILLFVAEGGVLVEPFAEQARAGVHLGPHDALLLEGSAALAITPRPRVELLAVRLWRD